MLDPSRPWGIAECAEYLNVSKSHFAQCIRFADGFPAPLDPMTYTYAGRRRESQVEWAGVDVMTWRLGEARVTLLLRQYHDKSNEINA